VSGTGSVNTTGGGDGIVVTAPSVAGSASVSVGSGTTAYGGSVTAGGNGLVVSSAGGSEFVNMSGSITALNGRGIFMGPTNFLSSTSVTMNGATLSSTNGDGIFALNTNGAAGAVTIVNNAAITTAGNDPAGHVAAGIFVSTAGFTAPVSLSGTGSINAAGSGIDARMTGPGTLATLSIGSAGTPYSGSVTAHNGPAVNATTVGVGALLVNLSGTINASTTGVFASTTSTGSVTVNTAGPIYGVSGLGSKATTGIQTTATSGPTSITVGAEIAATTFGVQAASTTGSINVTVNPGALIDPACGICLASAGGNLTVNNGGQVVGGAQTGVGLTGGVNNVLNNTGVISNANGIAGLAVLGDTGNNVINNFGVISGNIALGTGANAFNNAFGGVFNAGPSVNLGAANTLTNNGTLAPGGNSVIQTTALTGKFVQTSVGTLAIDANAAAQADKLFATGTATLSGGTVLALAQPGAYGPKTIYTIVTATGGVAGTFAGATSSLPYLVASLSYDASDVFLTLTRNATFLQGQALTRNERAVASALDPLPTSNPLFQAVAILPGGALRNSLDLLSGEIHASTASALVDESLYMRSAILGRLRQASYGGDSEAMAALRFGGPQAAFADGADPYSPLAYAKAPLATKAPAKSPQASSDVVYWAQGFGASGKINSDGNAEAVKRDLGGLIAGFDARFGNWRGGLAAGYTNSHNNTDDRGGANVETGHIAAYGGWNLGAFNLRGGGAYAFHSIDASRTIAFPGFFDRATAHYEGGTGQVFGEASYALTLGRVALEPFAGAAWVHLRTDAFNEVGGLAALNVAANKFEVGYSTIGARAASMIPLNDNMILVPRVSAAWQHAFDNLTPAAAVAFQSTGTSFTVFGVPIARDGLLSEAGLDLYIGRNAVLGLSYVGQFATQVQDHAAKGKFSWKF
jgi:subtilase-type serine protease